MNFIKTGRNHKSYPGSRTYQFNILKNEFVGYVYSKTIESRLQFDSPSVNWHDMFLENTYLFRKLFLEFNSTSLPTSSFRTWLDEYDFSTIHERYDISSYPDNSIAIVQMCYQPLILPSDTNQVLDSPKYVESYDFQPSTPEMTESDVETVMTSPEIVPETKWADECALEFEQVVFIVDMEVQKSVVANYVEQNPTSKDTVIISNTGDDSKNLHSFKIVVTNDKERLLDAQRSVIVLPTVELLKSYGLYSEFYYSRLLHIYNNYRPLLVVDAASDSLGKFKMKKRHLCSIRSLMA